MNVGLQQQAGSFKIQPLNHNTVVRSIYPGEGEMSRHNLAVTAVVVAHLVLAGCATGRSVLPTGSDPGQNQAQGTAVRGIDAGQNPAQGTAVRIDAVQDTRVFSIRPPSPDVPSLMDNKINDKSITSRAVGRKRGGFGKALGDVLLPEGTTVSMLVQSTVTRALRESGYRVLGRGDPDSEQAVPISVRIDQFWAWFNPGFASVTLTCRATVQLQGSIPPLEQGRSFTAQEQKSMQLVVDSDWVEIVNKGLDGLAANIKQGIGPGTRSELQADSVAGVAW